MIGMTLIRGLMVRKSRAVALGLLIGRLDWLREWRRAPCFRFPPVSGLV